MHMHEVGGTFSEEGAPGRVRTDTGDPFRGSASATGLRGRANNNPNAVYDKGSMFLIILYQFLDAAESC